MMMKSIAQEVAPLGIRVNAISPGAVRTPINMDAWGTREAYNSLMTLIPKKRIGEPMEIGRATVWLASDDSDYITGTTIYVDGGMTLYPGFETGGQTVEAAEWEPRRHLLLGEQGFGCTPWMARCSDCSWFRRACSSPSSNTRAHLPGAFGFRTGASCAGRRCHGAHRRRSHLQPVGQAFGRLHEPGDDALFHATRQTRTARHSRYVVAQSLGGTLGWQSAPSCSRRGWPSRGELRGDRAG